MSILLQMVHLVGEALALVHHIQRKDLNIGSTGCMKYRPEYVLALLTLCTGSEQRYVIHQGLMD
jgi:hypothetical protein